MEIEQGKILVAQPFLNDSTFKRTVILISEHNEFGTMGFVVNKPTHLRLKDVLPELEDLSNTLFYGGPIEQNQLFFIHRKGKKISNSLPIANNLYWGGDFEEVIEMLRSGELPCNDIKFFIGYSGWEPMQLEAEIEQKAWFVSQADFKSLMNENIIDGWGDEIKKLGGNFAVFSNFPDNPSLN